MSDQHEITDARTMRALAHPTRLALLDLLRRERELTATRAAELLDESPGNMSWHLQTLAKYGFVEETGEGKGRSRPWRIVPDRQRFRVHTIDDGAGAAGIALVTQVIDRAVEQQRQWLSSRSSFPPEWQNSAFLNNSVAYLTPEELVEICEEVVQIFTRFEDRVGNLSSRPEAARPVHLTAFGHPLPLTEAGN